MPKVVGEFMGRNAASFGLYVQLRPEEKGIAPTDCRTALRFHLASLHRVANLRCLSDPRFAEFALDPHPHRPWDQDYAPLFRVGTLSLPSQNIDTDARWQLGQAIRCVSIALLIFVVELVIVQFQSLEHHVLARSARFNRARPSPRLPARVCDAGGQAGHDGHTAMPVSDHRGRSTSLKLNC